MSPSRSTPWTACSAALCATLPSEILEEQLGLLERLHRFVPMNPVEAREAIAKAVLDHGGYPLPY